MPTEFNENVKWSNDTLYSRDIHGNIISWNIRVEQDVINIESYNIIRNYGRLNGNKQQLVINITQGKNIGKKNATTPKQQAIKEAKAMVKDKAKSGYRSMTELGVSSFDAGTFIEYTFDTFCTKDINAMLEVVVPKEKLDANNFSKPMLATKYKGKAELPALIQPKINGVRCFVSFRENKEAGLFDDNYDVLLTSREGVIFDIPHVKNAFKQLYLNNIHVTNDIVFDGELFIFDKVVGDIAGAARNRKNPINNKFVYVCFDLAIPELGNIKRDFARFKIFNNTEFVNIFDVKDKIIINLGSKTITEQEKVIFFTNKYIQMGYEGCIIRQYNAEYQFGKRRIIMQKSKKFYDDEYKLIDIIPTEKETDSNGKPTCLFVCETETGERFNVTPYGYTKEMKAHLLTYKSMHIGKDITVKYYEKTKNGIPFHANGHIREYK